MSTKKKDRFTTYETTTGPYLHDTDIEMIERLPKSIECMYSRQIYTHAQQLTKTRTQETENTTIERFFLITNIFFVLNVLFHF